MKGYIFLNAGLCRTILYNLVQCLVGEFYPFFALRLKEKGFWPLEFVIGTQQIEYLGERMVCRSFLPLPCTTRISMRAESMSAGLIIWFPVALNLPSRPVPVLHGA